MSNDFGTKDNRGTKSFLSKCNDGRVFSLLNKITVNNKITENNV